MSGKGTTFLQSRYFHKKKKLEKAAVGQTIWLTVLFPAVARSGCLGKSIKIEQERDISPQCSPSFQQFFTQKLPALMKLCPLFQKSYLLVLSSHFKANNEPNTSSLLLLKAIYLRVNVLQPKSSHMYLASLQACYWPLEQDAEGRAIRHPLLLVAVLIASYPSKGRRDIASKEGPGCCFLPLPSLLRNDVAVRLALPRNIKKLLTLCQYSSVFFHRPSKAALEKIEKKNYHKTKRKMCSIFVVSLLDIEKH